MPSDQTRRGFWREAIALQGAVTFQILPSILCCGVLACVSCAVARSIETESGRSITVGISPFTSAGAVLGILLVIRLNAGYDRWWAGRILWGGIVNQSRNLVISALAFGPHDREWCQRLVRWVAAFSHVARHSLRSELPSVRLNELIGAAGCSQLTAGHHMPSVVAWRIGELLREATERFNMDGFSFMQIDRERTLLMDHVGGCERILATPLPRIYSITIRRFILLFLIMLPLALLNAVDVGWFVPILTMLIAYPLLALDQIGVELENPFSTGSLSHLPLDDIAENLERNLFSLLFLKHAEGEAPGPLDFRGPFP